MCFSTIEPIGKLYKNDISVLRESTDSVKIVFSVLRSLQDTKASQQQGGSIHITTQNISDFSTNLYSPRSVRRYLNELNKYGFYSERYDLCKQKLIIDLDTPDKKKGFTFIFAPSNPELLQPSMIIMLSMMLDKAAFNVRAGLRFKVTTEQLNSILNELSITKKTMLNNLSLLLKHGLISALDSGTTSPAGLFNQGIRFSDYVKEDYARCADIQFNSSCAKAVNKTAEFADRPYSNNHNSYNFQNNKKPNFYTNRAPNKERTSKSIFSNYTNYLDKNSLWYDTGLSKTRKIRTQRTFNLSPIASEVITQVKAPLNSDVMSSFDVNVHENYNLDTLQINVKQDPCELSSSNNDNIKTQKEFLSNCSFNLKTTSNHGSQITSKEVPFVHACKNNLAFYPSLQIKSMCLRPHNQIPEYLSFNIFLNLDIGAKHNSIDFIKQGLDIPKLSIDSQQKINME